MSRLIYLSLILFLILASCKSLESGNENNKSLNDLDITTKFITKVDETKSLQIEITNVSNDTLTLINPVIKTIEKLNNGNWTLQRILYCPCGAACQQAIPRMEFIPDQKMKLEWNLNESWCVREKDEALKTIVREAKPGIYRIKIKYEKQKYQTKVLYKEFEIVK